MRELYLIHVSGDDRPGITAAISAILAAHDVTVLDVGQAVIHNTLLLGMLVEMPRDAESAPVFKEVLFRAHELQLGLRFEPISEDSYQQWRAGQGKRRHIITLLARRVTAQHIARVSDVLLDQDLNIESIRRLSGRVDLEDTGEKSRACVEFSVRGEPGDRNQMRAAFMRISAEQDVDIAFQEDSVFRRNRRLVVFDMDSTLIETEVINELAEAAGVGEQVAEITERAMRGELDFQESFRARVGQLAGLDESVLEEIAERLPITEGAERLVATLRSVGYRTAIISGGFSYFGERLRLRLGIDHVFANELPIRDGKVTGEVAEPIVDGKRKADLLREIAAQEGIRLEQVIAVGDGANDLPMLNLAGLGIAFRAKPLVKESAEQSISTLGLDGILYLLGFRDEDVVSG